MAKDSLTKFLEIAQMVQYLDIISSQFVSKNQPRGKTDSRKVNGQRADQGWAAPHNFVIKNILALLRGRWRDWDTPSDVSAYVLANICR